MWPFKKEKGSGLLFTAHVQLPNALFTERLTLHQSTTVHQSDEGPWVWPEEGRLTASSNGVRQASEGRDALGVRIEVHAIFLFRDFPNVFPR